jgi:pimeloyl-ACP methyl ester carboxylesterase
MRRVPYREVDVFAQDEVVLRAWTNGAASGTPVLICNGLAAPAECWPGLYDSDGETTGLRVLSYFHRGTYGSGRPLDESATDLSDYVEDAVAVLRHFGVERTLVVGWSVGAAVAFDLASRRPDLVGGILAVSGVPRGREGLGRLVQALTQPVTAGALEAARTLPGPLLDLVGNIPVDQTVGLLQAMGLLSGAVDDQRAAAVLRKYLEHDPQWYLRIARQAAVSGGAGAADVRCPVRFLCGRGDPIVSPQSVIAASAELPGSSVELIAGSHFLPLEHPDVILAEIHRLAAQAGL